MDAASAPAGARRDGSRQREYQRREPEKTAARHALREAVSAGLVQKPTDCEACGEARPLHGHHRDYAHPLVVAWLCAPCHGREHARLRAESAARLREATRARATGVSRPDGRRVGSRRRELLSRFTGDRGLSAVRGRILLAILTPVDGVWPVPVPERLMAIRRSTSLPPDARVWLEEIVATHRT